VRSLARFALIAALAAGCAGSPKDKDEEYANPAAQAPNVRAAVNQITTAIENKDLAALSRVMAHDEEMVCFGIDAGDRWVGWEAMSAAMKAQFETFDEATLTVRDQVVRLSPDAGAAHFSELVDWDMNVQGRPVQRVGSRFSGVLEQRDGNWVCVQLHMSMPVAGQTVAY
jgi:ketosteroid isomerase-like protein